MVPLPPSFAVYPVKVSALDHLAAAATWMGLDN